MLNVEVSWLYPIVSSTRIYKRWHSQSPIIGPSSKSRYTQLRFYILFSLVSIATGYWLYDRGVGVRVPVGSSIFPSPPCLDRLWGPQSLLSNGYRGYSGRSVKLTTHLQLVPGSTKCGSIHPVPHTPSWRNA
jgi:hypothetical protein